MAEEGKTGLFREKSLEAIESPESLNDYLRVTSPGVWLVLATVVVLLAGFIVWGIFGRINTTMQLAVEARDGSAVCYVPYDSLQKVLGQGYVTIGGKDYTLQPEREAGVTIVSEEMNAYIRVKGNLQVGDMTVQVPVDADLSNGIYAATVVTESLQPASLLLQ